jgi:TolB-like protein
MSESTNAVFLSYASQDAVAARRICEALRVAGITVWFDENELRGGDAWDASIRKQIRECALFVPLISAATEARSEGYFRLEWRLAVERSHQMADDQAFLLPVVIDATPEASARVPDRFRERQWTRLDDGATPPEFVERVQRLLAGDTAPASVAAQVRIDPPAAAPRGRPWLIAGATLAFVIIASAIAFSAWNSRHAASVTASAPATANTPALDPKSVAVLPFDNLSGRAEDAYLADGLQEEILNALARVRDLKVISRTSVMEYRGKAPNVREISQRLGVGTILEGSIRRDGNTLRLTVQLIDARDDRHLLAANYDRDLAHVLDLQSTVARQVAEALAATLTLRERGEFDRVATNSGDAYNRYLQAVALFRRPAPNDNEGLVEPKRLLGEALRFDPDYADALALLSRANTWAFFFSRRPEDGAAAKSAFERALAIDPKLPEAHLARGMYAMYVAADLDQALAELEAVVQARPNSAEAHSYLGWALRRRGRIADALEQQVRASDLDPLNLAYTGPVITLLGLRRYPEAVEWTKTNSKRFPNEPDWYFTRARIEGYLQNSAEPLRTALRDHGTLLDPPYHKAIEAEVARAEGRYLDAVQLWAAVPTQDPLARAERIGFLYLAAGDASHAEQSFRGGEEFALGLMKREPGQVDLVQLGMVQSMLGKHAAALATIEEARTRNPESRDATNGPYVSFVRSVILVRAGRVEEGYAEVARLLRVPFGSPVDFYEDPDPPRLLLKGDPHYDELLNHPPRL